MKITKVTILDIDQLQEIGRQTFSETFSAVNTEENMRKYLDDSFSAEMISAELKNRNSEFYFAILGHRVVGYMKLNYGTAQTEFQDDKAIEIERIYVLKEFHGAKVGQQLYDWAMHISGEKKAHYVWLGVWENNKRAISFYKKNGFTEFDKHNFKLGDDVQTDLLMKRILRD